MCVIDPCPHHQSSQPFRPFALTHGQNKGVFSPVCPIFSIRNKVNQLFTLKLQVKKPVLASITRTKGKQNILLTITEEYNIDFLIKYKEIWNNCFIFKREQKLKL